MKHYYNILITGAFFLLSTSMVAQNKLNTLQVDKITYDSFLKGDWHQLIQTGKEAIDNGIEFYYLDVRMGVAYYSLKKYRTAVKYFDKAYKLNNNDDYVKQYLYYSYLFAGREKDAGKIKKTFDNNTKKELGLKQSGYTVSFSLDTRFEINEDYKADIPEDGLLTQTIREKYNYFSIGMDNSFYQNSVYVNFANINKISNFYNPVYDSVNYIYNQEYDKYTDNQKQIYINYSTLIAKGLSLTLAVNWVHLYSRFDSASYEKTTNLAVGVFALRKDFGNFKAGLFSSFSNLGEKTQIQPGLDIIWFPFANDNFYVSSIFTYKFEKSSNENFNDINFNEMIIKPAIGFRIKNFYFEPSYTIGNIKNVVEYDGLVVDNDIDVIKNRFEFLTYAYFLKNRLYAFFKYQYYTKENIYWVDFYEKRIDYNNNTFTFGIQFSF